MENGYVGRFVYGGGNMGSVGKGDCSGGLDDYSYFVAPTKTYSGFGETLNGNLWDGISDDSKAFLGSGKTEVEVIGGQVGTTDLAKMVKDGLPYGSVFGGSRGESAPNIGESPRYLYSPEFFSGYVNETKVTIGGYRCNTPYSTYKEGDGLTTAQFNALTDGKENWVKVGPEILGSVFGGGQDGHVRRDTHVIVDDGVIGLAYNTENRQKVGTLSFSVGEGEPALTDEQKDARIADHTDLDDAQWLHRGNVYGAGSGISKYEFDFNNDGTIDKTEKRYPYTNPQTGRPTAGGVKEFDYSTSAGSVTCLTQVEINGGIIHRNVYGGGSNASVGPPVIPPTRTVMADKKGDTTTHNGWAGWQSQNTVIIRGTVGTPEDYKEHYGGEVYGASRGETGLDETFANSVWTLVRVLNGANIKGNVFGGGDNGMVKKDSEVNIGGE